MKVIWKYPIGSIDNFDEQILCMPDGANIVHTGLAPDGKLCLWAEVDPTECYRDIRINIRGTGQTIPENSDHIGTFIDGPFVWHLYRGRSI